MSPTARSLALLRGEGFLAEVCEKWIPRANVRRDLFGIGDILAFHPIRRVIMLVQTTTRGNLASRRKKAQALAALAAWTDAGGQVEWHGWAKRDGKWECKRIGIEACEPGMVDPSPLADRPPCPKTG